MAATGKPAPKRQGAVLADFSGSEVNPVLVGGLYMSSPSSVDNNDAAWFPTGPYGEQRTGRFSMTLDVTIGSADAVGEAYTAGIDFGSYDSMIIHTACAWTESSLMFYACATQSGTYHPLYDEVGNAIGVEVSPCYAIAAPSAIRGCQYLKLFGGDTPGTCITQSTDRTFGLTFKS